MCIDPEPKDKKYRVRIREHHNMAFEIPVEVDGPAHKSQERRLPQPSQQLPPTLVWEGAD
jgi:hypothetical protein